MSSQFTDTKGQLSQLTFIYRVTLLPCQQRNAFIKIVRGDRRVYAAEEARSSFRLA